MLDRTGPNQITAIETRYAGCHFRSRLEARWAVFFDHLGIRWEYEPEGIMVGWRLALRGETFPYLPDFWLPEYRLWVEVKGAWNRDECDRFLNAAASLSQSCGPDQTDVLLLGPVPDPTHRWSPLVLHMHKGDLRAHPWADGQGCRGPAYPHPLNGFAYFEVGRDVGGDDGEPYLECGHSLDFWTAVLLHGWPVDHRYAIALTAARSARFEHGQSGPT